MDNNLKKILDDMFTQASALGACDRYTGRESLSELARLFKSPQGVEFSMKTKFPSMTTLRELKKYGLQQYGIYVDAGEVEINEPDVVVVAGRTSATINCATHGRHRVVAMRGANVTINSREWSVVVVKNDPSCHLMKNQFDNSIIL